MKKILLPLVVLLLSGLLVLNYYAYQSPTIKKMISQQTIYQTKENEINIPLYSNHKGAYQTLDAIDQAFLKEADNKLELLLTNIITGERYPYLKETYHKYIYTFSLPILENHYHMKDATLELYLKNGQSKQFLIGSFDYYYQPKNTLELTELHALKYEDAYQIKSISMTFNLSEAIYVEHIKLSNDIIIQVDQTITDKLEVSIPKLGKIVDRLSVVLVYTKADESYLEVLIDYLYFTSNENPLDYGYLNYVTLID